MNMNEAVSPITNPRLKRIRAVALALRIVVALSALAVATLVLLGLSNAVGWTHAGPNFQQLDHYFGRYASLLTVPPVIVGLEAARCGLFFAGAIILNRLLRLFADGKFFTAAHRACLTWLGGLVIGHWAVLKLLDAFACRQVVLGIGDFASLTVGLLTLLLAWILDEGRKIQEEQALTV